MFSTIIYSTTGSIAVIRKTTSPSPHAEEMRKEIPKKVTIPCHLIRNGIQNTVPFSSLEEMVVK